MPTPVTYANDLAGKPVTIAEEGGPVLATFGGACPGRRPGDAPGRRVRLTRGNGVETRYAWDPASRLATLAQDPAGTAQDGATGFTWTAAGQLRAKSQTGAELWDWAGPAGAPGGYAPDKLDRYRVTPGTPPPPPDLSPLYDPAGNLVRGEGSGQAFAYDVEGKLRIADDGITFRLIDYDPLGRLRRVGPDGRLAVHAGAQLMAEYEPGGALAKRHVFAPGLDEPLVTYAGGAKTFHVADERGSVVAATDAAGMVVTSWGYGPHGEPDARSMAPAFGFTGALSLPQLGLSSMRARVYSHRLGRFLQPDPIGQAGGINLYDYAGGDPVNGWDPLGLGPMVLGPQPPDDGGIPVMACQGRNPPPACVKWVTPFVFTNWLELRSFDLFDRDLRMLDEQGMGCYFAGNCNAPVEKEERKPRQCISRNAGPVNFTSVSYSQDLIIGAGAEYGKYSVPSQNLTGRFFQDLDQVVLARG